MPYHNYQLRDFLNDDSFIRWVLFGENEPFWQDFMQQRPAYQSSVVEARQLILKISDTEQKELPTLDEKAVWSRIKLIIDETDTTEQETPVYEMPVRRLWAQPAWRWAAVVMAVLGIGWLMLRNQPGKTVNYQDLLATVQTQDALIEKVNDSDQPLSLTLTDGSIVTLSKQSRLSYANHFDKHKRTVFLSGEAFFDVVKDPSKPFYVYANEVVTKVLGTSFRIRAFEQDKHVLVNVQTGRVSVYSQRLINLNDPETTGLVLLPNQQAVFSRETESLSKHLVESPLPVQVSDMPTLPSQFDEVSATNVLKVIEKRYGVKLVFNEELLSKCVITTTLGNESLYDQLDLICKIIGATYKEVDAQIVLESEGCK